MSFLKSWEAKISDAFIAATVLVYVLTSVTHNLADFVGIPELKQVDGHGLWLNISFTSLCAGDHRLIDEL